MGGIIILLSIILPTILWADISNNFIQIEKETLQQYSQDIKESLYYFIDDILTSNVEIYKYKDFDNILYEKIYDIINDIYAIDILDLNLDIPLIIEDSISIYFQINKFLIFHSFWWIRK